MNSDLNSKTNLIGLNSIENPINKEINELTEIELNNDNKNSNNQTKNFLDIFSLGKTTINNLNAHQTTSINNQGIPEMKTMLVSLDDTNSDQRNSNYQNQNTQFHLFTSNNLNENSNSANILESSNNSNLMNAVHLNHYSNNNNLTSCPNVAIFGLRSNAVENQSNHFLGNFNKLKNRNSFFNFFHHLKFIWHRATLLERLFCLLAIFQFIAIFYLMYQVLTVKTINTKLEKVANKQKYCVTPQCVNVASAMLSAMDDRVSPCDNFYKYACGGWINSNPLPQGKSIWGTFGKLWQENQLAMKKVLEENVTYLSDAQLKAKLYYRSCLDKNETIERFGAKPLLDFIDLINGWNITGKNFNVKNWTYANSLEILHCKFNRGGLFSWAVGADERNSSRHVLQLDQAFLGLPSSAYYSLNNSDNNVLRAYEHYMVKVVQMLHKNEKILEKSKDKQHSTNPNDIFYASILNDSLHVNEEEDSKQFSEKSINLLEFVKNIKNIDSIRDYEKNLLEEYEENKEIERQMKLVLKFEIELANITVPLEERRDDERIYHKYTLKQLNNLCPALNWIRYFKYAFEPINYTITENEPIIVYSPEYMSGLSKLILKYNATEEGRVVLANYIVWTAVQSLTSYLSKPFRDASKVLRKALIGSEGQESIWRYCVTDTNGVMGFALGAMFVDSVFKGDAKPIAQQMIEQIREAFKKNLLSLNWMDTSTRKLASEKADAITDMIGFPDFILDPNKLDEKYEGLEFSEIEYFDNNIKVNIFSLNKNIEKIFRPANKSEWQMSPPTVNAYYTPTKNQIVFPAGILQTPFYDIHYPKSLNFGAMGVVMGHELTHAFDDQGREYDKNGNLHQWWHNETIENFKERMNCFIEQYSNYTINGDHINGKQTLGENIADNGGLKASFRAYEEWMKNNELELALPGVNLTNHQLFFIGFAQVWCSVLTTESLKLQILNDPHTPAEYRVIGTLSNSKDFTRYFNCPLNSPMNPKKKCEVW